MTHKTLIDGNTVLYHFLQKELYQEDIWLFQMLTSRLVASLGVWFRPTLYAKMPLLVPYAVRDPDCRGRNADEEDEWGSPNIRGFIRDDNSLIRPIPSSLRIVSPLKDIYDNRYLGNGFVASHIWRKKPEPNTIPSTQLETHGHIPLWAISYGYPSRCPN